MRSFTKMEPYSLNGYAEIPDEFTNDYFDELYKDIDVWCGLTVGCYGLVKDEVLEYLVQTNLGAEREDVMNNGAIREMVESGYELVKLVGFDDDPIEEFSESIKEEAERLALQIDELMEKQKNR